ncbi:MAG: TlpA family protein disulfide reductase [Fluviicola sp.]|nr:TlpA family protein disulfide reductase [Fluviicola sp.]MBP6271271.1 TlpA family protein disulfide reductase [Fluviicola sp.]
MKKIALLFVCLSMMSSIFSQNDGKKVPSVQLTDLNGKPVNTANLSEKGPIVISFWATWCAPCKRELNTIHEVYEEWQKETGITIVAVSIDDEKTKAQVPLYVNGKGWEYVVLLDPNWDFKRAMGVGNVPHTFLIDAEGNIVYSHTGYSEGDEEKLLDEIRKLKNK